MEKYLSDKRVAVNAFINQCEGNPTLLDQKEVPSIEIQGVRPQHAKRHAPRRGNPPLVEINPEDHLLPIHTQYQRGLIASEVERLYPQNEK